jgi:hypothetical protein
MIHDPHDALRRQVIDSVVEGRADSDPALRRAAFSGAGLPADLATLVAKIHAHAYRVTDADVTHPAAVRGDDPMFEVIVSASIGAAEARFAAGMRALAEA